jgi:hypothetical protein
VRCAQELDRLKPMGVDARLAEVLSPQVGGGVDGGDLKLLATDPNAAPVEIRKSSFYSILRYRSRILQRAYVAIRGVGAASGGELHTQSAVPCSCTR